MDEFGFDHVDHRAVRVLRRPVVPARRLLHRLLRPVFFRLAERFHHLGARLDAHECELAALRGDMGKLSGQMQATLAFGWDYAAVVRRLAVLEDLLARQPGPGILAERHGEPHRPLVLFSHSDEACEGQALPTLKLGSIAEPDALAR